MTLKLNGSSSGYTAIDAPASAGSNTLVLPTTNGSAGQVLQTDGNGNLSWVTPGAGKVLQVVQTARLQSGSSGVTSWTTLAAGDGNVEVSITPSATSSKVLVRAYIWGFNDDDNESYFFRLARDGTGIGVGAAAGSRVQVGFVIGSYGAGNLSHRSGSIEYLDSPNTTSATTYALQGLRGSAGTFYFGRNDSDGNDSTQGRGPTIITAMEIGA